jgi:transposase-like protein
MTEKQARRYLEKVRWPNGPVCPHCGNGKKAYFLKGKSTRPGVYNCAVCKRQFTVTIGTVMEDTHLPLRTWLMAFSLMQSAKKGISALQLQRDLNIGSYKTAWRMLRLIRETMGNVKHGKTFQAIVEIDETYIGGKPRKSNRKDDRDKHNNRGRGTKKSPIIGIVDS